MMKAPSNVTNKCRVLFPGNEGSNVQIPYGLTYPFKIFCDPVLNIKCVECRAQRAQYESKQESKHLI